MMKIGYDFLESQNLATFFDDDMVVISNFHKLSKMLNGTSFKTEFVLSMICTQGRMQIRIDDEVLDVGERQAVMCPINTVVGDCLMSPDFRALALCLSTSCMKEFYLTKKTWQYYNYILRNHLMALNDEEMALFREYYALIFANIDDENKPYRKEIIKSLLQTSVYEFVNVLDRHIKNNVELDHSISDKNLTSRFMELLALSEGKTHFVHDFANRLCVTPKYLTQVVKKGTGKPPLTWIHEYMAKEIDRQLRCTDKPIKEICNNLEFPNISFFGRFVSRNLGDAPSHIRMRYQNNQTQLTNQLTQANMSDMINS